MVRLLPNPAKSTVKRLTSCLSFLSVSIFVFLLSLTVPAHCLGAFEFPGPVERSMLASPTWGYSVPWENGITDFAVIGDNAGYLNLLYNIQGEFSFGFFSRFLVGGEVAWVGPWKGGPHGPRGLVVATTNPDRLHFIEINYQDPLFTIDQTIELPEDPGTIDFLSPGPQGEPQLAVSLPGIDEVLVLRQNNNQWSVFQMLNTGDEPWSLVAIDLNNDQILELVAAGKGVLSGTLAIFSQNSDGSYELQSHEQLAGHVHQVGMEDFNLDGVQELIVSYSDLPQVDLFIGETGSLVLQNSLETSLVSDFFQVITLPGGNYGLLSTAQEWGLMDSFELKQGNWVLTESYYVGSQPVATLACDLNSDGVNDIVTMDANSDMVSILLGTGRSTFRGYPAEPLPSFSGSSVLADFDRDGHDEVVVGSFNGNLLSRYSFQSSGALFSAPVHQDPGFFPAAVAAGNLLGDNSLELIVLNTEESELQIFDQVPGAGFSYNTAVTLSSSPSRIKVADVDADGHEDLILTFPGQKEVQLLYGNSQGSFTAPVTLEFPIGVFEVIALPLNQDLYLDLVVSDGTSRIWILGNSGGREFGQPFPLEASSGARYLAMCDLDADADLDVVVANSSSRSLTIFENQGNGSLTRRIGSLSVGGKPTGIFCEDMNGDEIPDFIVPLADGDGLLVIQANDLWEYFFTSHFLPGGTPAHIQVSDFTQSGGADVLTLNHDLSLGIVLVNTDEALVAVDPTALSVSCSVDGFSVQISPDRPGPWNLSLGKEDQWQTLVSNGQALVGEINFDGKGWALDFSLEQAGYPDNSKLLKLTVGSGEDREELFLNLPTDCLADAISIPRVRWVNQLWPNPFNPRINGRLQLDYPLHVDVAVFDVAGHRVATLLTGALAPGIHDVSWDGMKQGQSAAAGLYFLRIKTENTHLSRKIMLIK